MLAAWSLVGVVTAFGVGIDASPILLPLAVVPLMFALFVVIGGRFPSVLAISAVAALGFAGLGAWNYLRAIDWEQAHPGAVDISGHDVSLRFVLLALITAMWSIGSFALVLRARMLDRHEFSSRL